MRAVLKSFVLLLCIAVVAGVLLFAWIGSRGISAKAQPGRFETTVARTMRRFAIPGNARYLTNPVARTPDVISDALAHFADHCATCHANDGSGDTEMGRGLYPKPPDMRLAATQSLTDGELFYIIENGVRLTGMPAWSTGTEEGTRESWTLVHFIRELPRLTSDQIEHMKTLNPRSIEDVRQELEEERFLEGEPDQKPPAPSPHKHGGVQQ